MKIFCAPQDCLLRVPCKDDCLAKEWVLSCTPSSILISASDSEDASIPYARDRKKEAILSELVVHLPALRLTSLQGSDAQVQASFVFPSRKSL